MGLDTPVAKSVVDKVNISEVETAHPHALELVSTLVHAEMKVYVFGTHKSV